MKRSHADANNILKSSKATKTDGALAMKADNSKSSSSPTAKPGMTGRCWSQQSLPETSSMIMETDQHKNDSSQPKVSKDDKYTTVMYPKDLQSAENTCSFSMHQDHLVITSNHFPPIITTVPEYIDFLIKTNKDILAVTHMCVSRQQCYNMMETVRLQNLQQLQKRSFSKGIFQTDGQCSYSTCSKPCSVNQHCRKDLQPDNVASTSCQPTPQNQPCPPREQTQLECRSLQGYASSLSIQCGKSFCQNLENSPIFSSTVSRPAEIKVDPEGTSIQPTTFTDVNNTSTSNAFCQARNTFYQSPKTSESTEVKNSEFIFL